MFQIFVINPGSTSTKIALYHDLTLIHLQSINHPVEELNSFQTIADQYAYRRDIIVSEMKRHNILVSQLDGIVARGGLLRPIPSGVYEINQPMLSDLYSGIGGLHASNLGAIIAYELKKESSRAKVFIADPPVVDEMEDNARFSGHPLFKRISIFHALNHKAIARIHADQAGKQYEQMNLIVAHLGGGISIAAHKMGRVVDVNQALDGEGPFSPERSGSLPAGDLVRLCFSGKYSQTEILRMITGQGGFAAYLGTNSGAEVEQKIQNNDPFAKQIFEVMSYQIAKEICGLSFLFAGKIDGILLTGGLAFSHSLINNIKQKVEFLAPVSVYPGEDEMRALAYNGYMVLSGAWKSKNYPNPTD